MKNLSIQQWGFHQNYESRDTQELGYPPDDVGTLALIPITDHYGREIDFPYPLDEDGAAKANASDDSFIIELKPYDEVAMNSFINS